MATRAPYWEAVPLRTPHPCQVSEAELLPDDPLLKNVHHAGGGQSPSKCQVDCFCVLTKAWVSDFSSSVSATGQQRPRKETEAQR